jgi:hypothetical protein
MADKIKDEAIANPQTNSGPRYPYAAVIWQGANHRMVFDDTPQNAEDTSGGTTQYNTDAGGGVMHISGKDGSRVELSSVSGRYSVMATGQVHQSGGKGYTQHFEGSTDERANGDHRGQLKKEAMSLTGDSGGASKGEQDISTSKGTSTKGTEKDMHNIGSGDGASSHDGNSFSQQRGDRVEMVKGTNVRVTEGEDAKFVIGGNGSDVYQKSFKIHVGEKFKHEVLDKYDTKASSDLVIESETKITLIVGGSSIVIDTDGIHIKADTVKIGGGGTVMVKGSDVKIGGGSTVEVVSSVNLATPPWISGGSPPDDPDAGTGANVGKD